MFIAEVWYLRLERMMVSVVGSEHRLQPSASVEVEVDVDRSKGASGGQAGGQRHLRLFF